MAISRGENNRFTDTYDIEAKLKLTADKLIKKMDATGYKLAVFGLLFLQYISDPLEEMLSKLHNNKEVGTHA